MTSLMHDYDYHILTSPSFTSQHWFRSQLKGTPTFSTTVIVRTKFFLYVLYFPLLSLAIKTYKVFSFFPVSIFDLIITATKPISYVTERVQCKTSSRVANTYKRNNTCLVFNEHSFTYFKKIQNMNT